MTQERKELIKKFQKWLDTNPAKGIIAAQCATIAEELVEAEKEKMKALLEGLETQKIDKLMALGKVGDYRNYGKAYVLAVKDKINSQVEAKLREAAKLQDHLRFEHFDNPDEDEIVYNAILSLIPKE